MDCDEYTMYILHVTLYILYTIPTCMHIVRYVGERESLTNHILVH